MEAAACGRPTDRTSDTENNMMEQTMMQHSTDDDPLNIKETTIFVRDTGITRDMVDQVFREFGFPIADEESVEFATAWILDYMREDVANPMGDSALALYWRHLRWRCRPIDVAGAPVLRDGPRIRFVAPNHLRVDPEYRGLLPRPSEAERIALRASLEKERRVLNPILVRAGDLTVIDGHVRHEEALRIGLLEVPILEEYVPHIDRTWHLVISRALATRQLSDSDRAGLAEMAAQRERDEVRRRLAHGPAACVRLADPSWREAFEVIADRIRPVLATLMPHAHSGKSGVAGPDTTRAVELLTEFLTLADRIAAPVTVTVGCTGGTKEDRE